MKHARIDQLSDGIFAIVITILVFEIKVPHIGLLENNYQLWQALKALSPYFGSYILSFALLFTYWRAHHFFVSVYAKNVDTTLSNINAIFFLLITLVPFSTSLISTFPNNELTIAIFGVHIILIGLALLWMRNYVLYSDHIKNPEITPREIRGSTIRTLAPVIFALIAIALSTISTKYSLIVFTLAVMFNLSSYSTRLFDKAFNKH